VETRVVPTGTVVCQRGDEGRAFYIVASGGLVVETATAAVGGAGRVFLGPGEIVGEMSLLSGLPVSATVVAVQPTSLHRIGREAFLQLLRKEPPLQMALTQLLVQRIRRRTEPATAHHAGVAIIAGNWESEASRNFSRALYRGISHYARGSSMVATSSSFAVGGPPLDSAGIESAIRRWRDSAGTGQYLMLVTDPATADRLDSQLARGDAVLTLEAPGERASAAERQATPSGLADRAVVELETRSGRRDTMREQWYFTIPPAQLDDALGAPTWSRQRFPELDRLARWMARREVGIALGSGAALGFAHLGVLEVLEDAGVPIDCLAGSSMGGIVALVYAREGNAPRATELTERTIGATAKVRDVSWWPRSALMVGAKVRKAAKEAGGGLTFAQLRRPAYVVAADLARSERVTIDRGPIDQALLATSAIPSLFPPVELDGRVLVDGALVSRIPLHVLERRRCALTIAVNVIPGPSQNPNRGARLMAAANRFMGFRSVLARSWELLGWWHGASDAALADILIEPACASLGHDFDSFASIVESGRRAARERLDLVRAAVENVLGPES
jgi:NTE family protein